MTSNSLLSTKLLYSLNNKRHRNKTLLQKGFTLVELMVVIVIVGVLSAVALPNFLSQTDKAKATEAKSNITAMLKQVQAGFIETGASPTGGAASATSALYGTPTDGTQLFDYTGVYDSANKLYTVMAKGNANDQNITDKKIFGCVALNTGVLDTTSNLTAADDTTTSDVECGITGAKDTTLS